jgi:heme-degrading monooxygenase HmoA
LDPTPDDVNAATDDHSVLEVAILDVRPGQAEAFQEAFASAERIIAAAQGFGGLELRSCVENEHRFLLLVWWDSVDSHEIGFRGSAAYQDWKALLHGFYEPFPTVEHYVPNRTVAGP